MKKFWMLPILAAIMLSITACSGDTESSSADDAQQTETSESSAAEVTEAETEEETIPTNAPLPEADPNAVTFDDGNFAFASIICDDATSADGTLSVEEIEGNPMLKYTDTTTTAENMAEMVQKVSINASALLAPEQLDLVNSIGFDLYVKAESDLYVNEDGENVKAPGWIGGGGGSVTADDKWYGFADFAASDVNEYVLERSDAYRVEFKFLLASGGKKWDAAMEDANFLIMRWGMENLASMYIDNITFYDESGNSIPLTPSTPSEESETEAVQGDTAETAAAGDAETAESVDETTETSAETIEETVETDTLS